MATPPFQPDEPVIVYTVRSLLRDMQEEISRQFEEFSKKLEDRPTLGMFRAAQSEADAHSTRLAALEDWQTEVLAVEGAQRRISDRALAWASVIVALLTAVATIIWVSVG